MKTLILTALIAIIISLTGCSKTAGPPEEPYDYDSTGMNEEDKAAMKIMENSMKDEDGKVRKEQYLEGCEPRAGRHLGFDLLTGDGDTYKCVGSTFKNLFKGSN